FYLGQTSIQPGVPGGVPQLGRGRLQLLKRRRAKRAGQHLGFELVQYIERNAAPLDRPLPPLGGIVLALRAQQRINASNGAKGGRWRRRFRRIAFVDREAAGSR